MGSILSILRDILVWLLGPFLALTAIFLILLVLVQRGRGGGLTGALGGMGGQSAFGAKAGDVFTRITIGTAAVWIILCVASVKLLGQSKDLLNKNLGEGPLPSQGTTLTQPPAGGASGPSGPSGGSPAGPAGQVPPASGPAGASGATPPAGGASGAALPESPAPPPGS